MTFDLASAKELIRAGLWLGYVLLAVLLLWLERRGGRDIRWHRAVHLFIAFTLTASFAAGLLRVRLWPFSAWSMMADVRTPTVGHVRAFGVDERGREHPVDYRAWEPMQWEELMAWMDYRFPSLDASKKHDAAAFLFEKAETARRRSAEGSDIGYLDRFLGPLMMPEHMLHPEIWTSPASTPSTPFVGLRLIREYWNVDVGRGGGLERITVYDYMAADPP